MRPVPSRALRRGLVAVVVAITVLAAATIGLAWYSAVRLTDVVHVGPSYPLRVLSVGRAQRYVVLSRGPDALEPGTFRLAWKGGQAVVGAVAATTASTVTRELSAVVGHLSPGQAAGVQADRYTGDPWQALRIRFRSVRVPTPLGPMPAWYVPGALHTWVIVVHGLGGSRADGLSAISLLHPLGFPTLAITYRNDVGAPASRDHLSHLGTTEWRDVGRAVDYAMSHGASGVVLYGYSLGGAMCLVTAHDPAYSRHVEAIVLDSPLLDWRSTLAFQASRVHLPAFMAALVATMASWRTGADLSMLSEPVLERDLSVPALLFQGTADTVVPPYLAARFARADRRLVTYVAVKGADHVGAVGADPSLYRAALDRFLARFR